MTCSQLGLWLGFQRSELTNEVDSILLCSNSLVSIFGCFLGKLLLKPMYFSQIFGQELNVLRRGKAHKAYPSASFLWMSDNIINTIIHLSSLTECHSGPISGSPPLMVPDEGSQARGCEVFSWVSLYPPYHFLNLSVPTAKQRRNGLLQLVEFGVKLHLNQEVSPQKGWTLYRTTSAKLRSH